MKRISLLPLVLLAACTAAGSVTPAQLEIIELSRGQHARAGETQSFELLTTTEALAEAWRRIGEAPPVVDFTGQVVIVVFMGRQRSGGHSISVSSVTHDGDVLQVSVQRRVPGVGCMTTMALTAPYQAVLVPARAARAEFSVETEAVNCQ